jgi:hypothetical protein
MQKIRHNKTAPNWAQEENTSSMMTLDEASAHFRCIKSCGYSVDLFFVKATKKSAWPAFTCESIRGLFGCYLPGYRVGRGKKPIF